MPEASDTIVIERGILRRIPSGLELACVALGALVLVVVLPCLNAFTPADSALHISDFTINLYGKYLSYAVLAVSVDLLWGYTGLLCLGQCLFFSLGGYALGMYLMLMIGKLGQYHSDLPDFMVFLGYPRLPVHWVPFRHFWFAVAAVVWVPAAVALVFGYLAFRSRIRGVYFSILTQALTYAASLMFFRNDFTFGGNNGFTDFKFIVGYDLRKPATQRALYIATSLLLFGTYAVCKWLTATKFGKVQRAVRDSENRVLFSGYATANFKLFIFVLSAVIAALAGALYVPQVGGINPSEMTPAKSLEAVVWVAVGGRGTLVGPVLGAIGVNALKSWASRAYPDLWLIILGALFSLVVLFLPGGIVSIPRLISQAREKAPGPLRAAMKPEFILTVEDVSKEFDGFKAISNLNFYLDRGEMRVVIGPNGAGKSTFFDLLTGRTKPDSGRIEFGAKTDLTALNEYQINRLGIGRKFQTPSVYVDHTVYENLLLSLKGPRGVFAALFHRTSAAERARIGEILQLIRLEAKRGLRAGQLAHGEKQWLEIGMLLAQDPEVLLVDEPAAGMTDEETHRTGELLISLAGRHSLIVVEHDMTFVKQIAQDRKVTVLHQGSVLCEGRFEEVQGNPQVREVYLGRGKGRK